MKKRKPQNSPPTRQAGVVVPTSVVAQGDGSYLVRAGRPMTRLTPAQFATRLGVSRNSVYRWIEEGTVPQSMIEYAGLRLIFISAAAVDHVLAEAKRRRGE